jgi:hypothetical protein
MAVALGLRTHPGWAVAVVVGYGPQVHAREQLDLPGPVRPYHEAVGLPIDEASTLVDDATTRTYGLAGAAVRRLAAAYELVGVAIVAGAGSVREDVPLRQALESHGTLHAAEAELYRDALAEAADGIGLPVTLVAPRETPALGRRVLGCDDEDLPGRLTALGRPFGRPWTRDHKDALVAALAVLDP